MPARPVQRSRLQRRGAWRNLAPQLRGFARKVGAGWRRREELPAGRLRGGRQQRCTARRQEVTDTACAEGNPPWAQGEIFPSRRGREPQRAVRGDGGNSTRADTWKPNRCPEEQDLASELALLRAENCVMPSRSSF